MDLEGSSRDQNHLLTFGCAFSSTQCATISIHFVFVFNYSVCLRLHPHNVRLQLLSVPPSPSTSCSSSTTQCASVSIHFVFVFHYSVCLRLHHFMFIFHYSVCLHPHLHPLHVHLQLLSVPIHPQSMPHLHGARLFV
ncbi:hypothetical protein CEXT_92171 [Caerostris extrusa]|uniref:Uncharacterized protein n=1 Tax=Caerostris extrusa TaxID=172846 RepID=A0AAV4UHD2_CAEEX|nr:hypothetical protein CEXT_92171 [Caerostris extrusa]